MYPLQYAAIVLLCPVMAAQPVCRMSIKSNKNMLMLGPVHKHTPCACIKGLAWLATHAYTLLAAPLTCSMWLLLQCEAEVLAFQTACSKPSVKKP